MGCERGREPETNVCQTIALPVHTQLTYKSHHRRQFDNSNNYSIEKEKEIIERQRKCFELEIKSEYAIQGEMCEHGRSLIVAVARLLDRIASTLPTSRSKQSLMVGSNEHSSTPRVCVQVCSTPLFHQTVSPAAFLLMLFAWYVAFRDIELEISTGISSRLFGLLKSRLSDNKLSIVVTCDEHQLWCLHRK